MIGIINIFDVHHIIREKTKYCKRYNCSIENYSDVECNEVFRLKFNDHVIDTVTIDRRIFFYMPVFTINGYSEITALIIQKFNKNY